MNKFFVVAAFISTAAIVNTAVADMILTAPPRESVEAGKKVYGPLAEYLAKVTGEKIVYEHPQNWRNYTRNMKAGKYAITFDGPHFAAWRINKGMDRPGMKLPGQLHFSLVTAIGRNDIAKVDDLIGKKVCAMPSPNLATLTAYSMYPNPMQQPQFTFVQSGGMKGIAKKFLAGGCDGAILRTSFMDKKLTAEQRAKLKVLTGKGVSTNQGITISRSVNDDLYKKIINSLTTKEGNKAMEPIINRFRKKGKFYTSNDKDYEGQNLLVDNMIFGW